MVAPGDEDMWGYLPEVAQIMRNPGRPIDSQLGDGNPSFSLIGYCEVCARPIDVGYATCYQCKLAISKHGHEMPAVVVPLTYAGATLQSRRDVYNYKGSPPADGAVRRLTILMWMYAHKHSGCIRRHVGSAITSVVTVPSGRNRIPHPLDNFRRYFPSQLNKISALYTGAPRDGRAAHLDPADFAFQGSVVGDHVLVLEDSWVSGNNALGLAIQARRSGAEQVSVLSIARYLGEHDQIANDWLATAAAKTAFDPLFCPVTRGDCPPA
ncbi:MAG: putative amidophosphoribosyltransferase [Arthrobacter sp.]|nr:putative amidophosphoribosyltransferase [Arthrobacter sp.]